MRRVDDVYKLTNRERWAKLAALHRAWGNVQLADHYAEMGESGD